ncbi:MAG: S41 family peptidase [Anaerolineae bacterium]
MREVETGVDGAIWPRAWRVIAGLLVAVLITASGFLVGFGYTWTRTPRHAAGNPVDLDLLWEAWGHVQQYFYGPTPAGDILTYGAIDGALETLGDPYTRLVRPVASEIEQDTLRGSFGGIGAYVYEEEGVLYLRPLPDSAAERAGVLEGDRLVAVDDRPLPEGATVDQAVSSVRGPIGEAVSVTVYRPATGEELTFSIVREEVTQPTVEWEVLGDYDRPVGYLRITLFGERTADELQRALASVRQGGAEVLVLDLRGNPGGLLEAAVEVTSRFVGRGVVLYEVDAQGDERTYTVRPRVRVEEPMVILVDGNTASASEIVAGALQDHERARLVGATTHGKGSVQFSYALSDGSSLHVTSALWLTPNRREINGVGLAPDIAVEPVEGEDATLAAGLQALGVAKVAVTEVAK